jgi:hypothetical protein
MSTLISNKPTPRQVGQLLKKLKEEERKEILHKLEIEFYGKRHWTWDELCEWGQRTAKEKNITEDEMLEYIMERRHGKKS